jgi:DNA primase
VVSVGQSAAKRIDTERIRQQHPIAEVVERYGIQLHRAGSALVGRCPFHADGGRPNLVVYTRSARFVCFRCQIRGDAIAFVQQVEQLSFRDAVLRLDECGVTPVPRIVRRRIPFPRGSPVRSEDELRALAAAVELYANRLLGDRRALDYLAMRGFARDVLVQQRIGFAAGDELLAYLAWRNVPASAARRVGLLRTDGLEKLAGRIVFPEIRQRQPIWLIGRLLEPVGDPLRYLGLPGPKPLLGWDESSRDRRGVCIVEGPMDLLALQQWGVPGLALCGTGFSPTTLSLLGQWERLYAVLDADEAGKEATTRLTEAFGSRVIPVQLPPGVKDPADLASLVDGSALLQQAIRHAVDLRVGPAPTPIVQPATAAGQQQRILLNRVQGPNCRPAAGHAPGDRATDLATPDCAAHVPHR